MSSDELIANLFIISQTEQKLKNDKIKGEKNANDAHYIIGKNIRGALKKNVGTMQENLLTLEKSIKESEFKILIYSNKKLVNNICNMHKIYYPLF